MVSVPLSPAALTLIAVLVLLPSQSAAQTLAPSPPGAAARDSLLNGTLIGAGVGFATGFVGLAAFNAKETATGPIWDGEAIGSYVSAGFLGAAIGAGLGAVIDLARKDQQSPFPKRPVTIRPIVQKHRRAVIASLKF